VAITWDKARWEQTYRLRLVGNVIAEGYAEPFGACTLNAASDVITKANHGYQVDDLVYFQSLPLGSGLCDSQVDCPYLVMSLTPDTFQVRPNTNRFEAIPLLVSGPAEVAKSRKGEWLTYSTELFSRDARDTQFGLRRDRLLAAFPEMQTSDRILIVGCSFLGLEVKAFRDAGFANCFGLDDTDDWPGGPTDVVPDGVVIVNENVAAPALKTRLRQGTGDDIFDWIWSSDVLTSAADDTEAALWASAAEEVLGNVGDPSVATQLWRIIHSVTINAPPPFLAKTLLQWQAVAPAHSWTDPDAKTILRG
jgi:hypothetical protein